MNASGDGWFELETDRARVGSRYSFVLPDGFRVPDPASRFQPDDVHGPSEVIDPAAYFGLIATGRGVPGTKRLCTSYTSAHSLPRARLPPRYANLIISPASA